jgi:ergothioneine biosynthesis protein EgtC
MCRFIAYLGHAIILDDILFKPRNSLIQQSIHAREMTEEPLNGDGFGIGWYAPEIDNIPALFKSIQPAWNDLNLQNLAPKIRSNCFFAHVRAASTGGVNYYNTHPFAYKDTLFMHNGDIGGFEKIKRHLRHSLSDEIYNWIKGQTDSEHFFALFLETGHKNELYSSADRAAANLIKTIAKLKALCAKHNINETSYINATISNGKWLIAVRYISQPQEKAPTLYFSTGSKYEYHNGICHMSPPDGNLNQAVLVASEKLTSHKAEWQEIPVNHILIVYSNLNTEIRSL